MWWVIRCKSSLNRTLLRENTTSLIRVFCVSESCGNVRLLCSKSNSRSSSEMVTNKSSIDTLLKPYVRAIWKKVHPDLFHSSPEHKKENESGMQKLQNVIEQQKQYIDTPSHSAKHISKVIHNISFYFKSEVSVDQNNETKSSKYSQVSVKFRSDEFDVAISTLLDGLNLPVPPQEVLMSVVHPDRRRQMRVEAAERDVEISDVGLLEYLKRATEVMRQSTTQDSRSDKREAQQQQYQKPNIHQNRADESDIILDTTEIMIRSIHRAFQLYVHFSKDVAPSHKEVLLRRLQSVLLSIQNKRKAEQGVVFCSFSNAFVEITNAAHCGLIDVLESQGESRNNAELNVLQLGGCASSKLWIEALESVAFTACCEEAAKEEKKIEDLEISAAKRLGIGMILNRSQQMYNGASKNGRYGKEHEESSLETEHDFATIFFNKAVQAAQQRPEYRDFLLRILRVDPQYKVSGAEQLALLVYNTADLHDSEADAPIFASYKLGVISVPVTADIEEIIAFIRDHQARIKKIKREANRSTELTKAVARALRVSSISREANTHKIMYANQALVDETHLSVDDSAYVVCLRRLMFHAPKIRSVLFGVCHRLVIGTHYKTCAKSREIVIPHDFSIETEREKYNDGDFDDYQYGTAYDER